jgi:predicted 2-oxoglutarate/Fe(II)-dependent dioxygenase YbiX
VFDPAFCQRLIHLYEAHGGRESGFMRDEGGRTIGIVDHRHKRRADYVIEDEAVRGEARAMIARRLLPEILKAFQFRCTRLERYIVACYDSGTGGWFRPHRDNTTKGTAHRKFAATINLNAEEYEGGELRFPEFGPRTYRAPTGGCVVFSCSLLHEALPVTKGRRYAFLPFLYDEAGARVRAANARYIEEPATPAGP